MLLQGERSPRGPSPAENMYEYYIIKIILFLIYKTNYLQGGYIRVYYTMKYENHVKIRFKSSLKGVILNKNHKLLLNLNHCTKILNGNFSTWLIIVQIIGGREEMRIR